MTHSLPGEKLSNMKTTIGSLSTRRFCQHIRHKAEEGLSRYRRMWRDLIALTTSRQSYRLRLLLFRFYFLYFCNFLFFWLFTKRHGRQNLGFDVRHLRFVSRDVTFGFEITSGCRPCLKNASCLSSLIYYFILRNFNMPFQKKKNKTNPFLSLTKLMSSSSVPCWNRLKVLVAQFFASFF